jgi:hypothetical protein
LNRVDNVSAAGGALAAIELVAGAQISWAATPERVDSGLQGSLTDVVSGESWLQMQDSILDETVLTTIDVHLELPVATATHGELVLPDLHVESVEIILEDKSFFGV